MFRTYVVCSNPSCRFYSEGNEMGPTGCPWCGGKTIRQCPHCKGGIYHPKALFCTECHKRLKPEPPAEKPRKTPEKPKSETMRPRSKGTR
jgi:hypothetical protein